MNPFEKIQASKTAATEPALIGYRLQSGCSSYVFEDGTLVSAAGGVLTGWDEKYQAEIDRNVATGAFREVFTEQEVRASLAVAIAGTDTLLVGDPVTA